ncbi:MAG: hypothetical protein M1598_05095, partial [Actinobacteria bacterium]|nr:hypothetical protein [Actinomycetota bacterium]
MRTTTKRFLSVVLALVLLLTQGALGPIPAVFAAGSPYLTGAETSPDGTRVLLTFDQDLFNSAIPSNFSVVVNGSGSDTVTNVGLATANYKVVELTLQAPITAGQTVTVSYYKPPNNGLFSADTHDPVASFHDQPVTNKVAAPPPTFVSAATTAGGTKILATFSKDMHNPGS